MECPDKSYEYRCVEYDIKPNAAVLKKLADPTFSLRTVTSLDFSWIPLGDSGACALLKVIKDSPNLQKLNMSSTGMRKQSALVFCDMFHNHKCLAEVDLSSNFLDSEALCALVDFAERTFSITLFDLSDNKDLCLGLQVRLRKSLEAHRNLGQASSPYGRSSPFRVIEDLKKNITEINSPSSLGGMSPKSPSIGGFSEGPFQRNHV
jgi:hypothetical protein